MEEKALELQCDQEDSRKELQQVKHEESLTRKKLQNLQSDKEALNRTEKALNAKITDLTRSLRITSKENENLQNKVNELEGAKCKQETTSTAKENENAMRSQEAMERMNAELHQLKVDLATSNESLDNANLENADLKIKLQHFPDAKTILETNIFHLEWKNSVSKTEKLMESVNKLKVRSSALEMEINSLRCSLVVNFTKDERREDELRAATEEPRALKTELTTLRDEKESLRAGLDTATSKLDRLESEKAALKNEPYTLRKINSDLKHKSKRITVRLSKVEEEECKIR
uniref:paramyosin-like n=1 Tax=Bombus vancouverensis nearcticus TaxID=2705178 RepID=UPI00143B4F9A|nr:paramyosin-like [Bombus vancouverensis nearcticus]